MQIKKDKTVVLSLMFSQRNNPYCELLQFPLVIVKINSPTEYAGLRTLRLIALL